MSGAQENIDTKAALASLGAVILLLVAYWASRTYLPLEFQENSLLALGLLVLVGLVAGRLCTLIGLPSLTGYLGAGLFLGPSGITLIHDAQVDQLRLVNSLALALIAMHAGCEFTKDMLTKNFRSLSYGTLSHILIIGLGMTAVFSLCRPWVDFLSHIEINQVVAVAALFAAIAVSKSPAAVVAILGETRIKNILSEHALGIVVILDVVVLVLFSVVLAFAKSSLNPDIPLSLDALGLLAGEIIASIAAGCFFGLFTIFYLRFIDRERMLFIVAISYGVTALCAYLHYDTLLVFVVAGFIVTNFSAQSEKMIATIESLSSVVMIVFFATAGASLHLSDLAKVWELVILLFVARVAFTWLAERTTHRLAGSPATLKTYGFTPFVSQAGLSIGLAMIVYDKLPDLGAKLATLAISVVTLNEIFGPVLFKWGLQQVDKKATTLQAQID